MTDGFSSALMAVLHRFGSSIATVLAVHDDLFCLHLECSHELLLLRMGKLDMKSDEDEFEVGQIVNDTRLTAGTSYSGSQLKRSMEALHTSAAASEDDKGLLLHQTPSTFDLGLGSGVPLHLPLNLHSAGRRGGGGAKRPSSSTRSSPRLSEASGGSVSRGGVGRAPSPSLVPAAASSGSRLLSDHFISILGPSRSPMHEIKSIGLGSASPADAKASQMSSLIILSEVAAVSLPDFQGGDGKPSVSLHLHAEFAADGPSSVSALPLAVHRQLYSISNTTCCSPCHVMSLYLYRATPQDPPLLHVLDKASGVFICYSLRRVEGSSMDDRSSDPQLLAMHPATPAPRNSDGESYRLELVPWRGCESETDDGSGFSSFAHLSLSLRDWIHYGESIFAPHIRHSEGLDPMRNCLSISMTLLLHRSRPAVTVLIGRRVLQTTIPLLWTDDFAEFREADVHPLDCSPAPLEVVSINCRGRCFGLLDKVLLQHYLPSLWNVPFEAVVHRPVDRYPCCPCHRT